MDIVIVGLGGAAGSVTRYVLGRAVSKRMKKSFPWGTFMVNVSGALLLGIVLGLRVHTNAALLLADGFLGAYTTFSTFMYEGFHLFHDNQLNAIIYIAGSLIVGLVFFAAGFFISNAIHIE